MDSVIQAETGIPVKTVRGIGGKQPPVAPVRVIALYVHVVPGTVDLHLVPVVALAAAVFDDDGLDSDRVRQKLEGGGIAPAVADAFIDDAEEIPLPGAVGSAVCDIFGKVNDQLFFRHGRGDARQGFRAEIRSLFPDGRLGDFQITADGEPLRVGTGDGQGSSGRPDRDLQPFAAFVIGAENVGVFRAGSGEGPGPVTGGRFFMPWALVFFRLWLACWYAVPLVLSSFYRWRWLAGWLVGCRLSLCLVFFRWRLSSCVLCRLVGCLFSTVFLPLRGAGVVPFGALAWGAVAVFRWLSVGACRLWLMGAF